MVHEAAPNTAMALDTDTVFHGVDAVGGPALPPPPVSIEAEIRRVDRAGDVWELVDVAPGELRARYRWEELRLSVSRKAYCVTDDAERDSWRRGRDDLTEEDVIDALVGDLVRRGRAKSDVARNGALGTVLIDTYVHYPAVV